ncbi:MAG: hydroxypyruvate isomerase family protein [Pikeienuella sp.]
MPRFAANLTTMFTDRPFLERFEAAAAAGFSAVELLLPYDHPPEVIRTELDTHDLALALMNTPAGDWQAGERGLASLPGRVPDFVASMKMALEYAAILKPACIHVMAGVSRGPWARTIYVSNLSRACDMAPDQQFAIEPINARDMPGYHLVETQDARTVIDAVRKPNLGLQLDLYHCQISEGDLTRRIETLGPLIRHVQIAGVPDRGEPDRGELALGHLLEVLDRVGFDGWIGCEYWPAGRTEDGLGWFAPWRRTPRRVSATPGASVVG